MDVVLVKPEIPPNTGNIARLCAATDTTLHLVHPLGFSLEDRYLKRAGLDYWPFLTKVEHESWDAFLDAQPSTEGFVFLSKKCERPFWDAPFTKSSALIFGSETRELDEAILERFAGQTYRIPMSNPNVRSLNLSTSVGVALYEAIRQCREGSG